MTLLRYSDAQPGTKNGKAYASFSDLVSDMFNTTFSDTAAVSVKPAANILEESNQFIIELAVPGYDKKNIKIDVENDQLTISGNMETIENEGESFRRREFNYGKFDREFILPDTIDTAKISAKYQNGVMYIHLPKKEEAVDQPPRQIKID